MSDNTAKLAGYTQEVMLSNEECILHLWVRPGTDLEGSFRAYDADECEFIRVNGWMFFVCTLFNEPVNL